MCVGALWPRAPHSALLFLGLVLGTVAQLQCPEHSYPLGDRCCRECQPGERPGRGGGGAGGGGDTPAGQRLRDKRAQGDRAGGVAWSQASRSPSPLPAGYGMESRCTDRHDTVCRPCGPGFYNERQNYARCKPCTQCSQRERPPRRSAPRPRLQPATGLFHRGSPGPRARVVGWSTCRPRGLWGQGAKGPATGWKESGKGGRGLSLGCDREGHGAWALGRTRSQLPGVEGAAGLGEVALDPQPCPPAH